MNYLLGVDPISHIKVKKHMIFIKEKKDQFTESVHELIKIRNKIFNLQTQFAQGDDPSQIGFTPENIIKFLSYSKKVEHDRKYDIFNTYDIKRISESSTVTESVLIHEDNIELSDIEEGDIQKIIG
mmetsp:Transcript_15376/g.13431  ORF Transcript_15376/g.13431 Transcript_15376/m.13431 type:complete len:126 (+) Transcript_15376:779-1156(+)